MKSIAYGAVVQCDAELVHATLATRFLYVKRGELRKTLGLPSSRLSRALLHLERKGILLAEHSGYLSLADRLWELRNDTILSHSGGV